MDKKVWYITGASKGLGLALVRKLLLRGCRVAASSRLLPALLEAANPDIDNFLPLNVDLSDEGSVAASLRTTWETFGHIDVVVNNAGYDSGVAAPLAVIQKAMPYLRSQGYGHILNIAPIAGFAGASEWPANAAGKNALIALSEVLARHNRSLGICITAVAPDAFRTHNNNTRTASAPYVSIDGKQIGDPGKAAEALISLASMPEPPTLLFLGSDAYRKASAKMAELSEQIDRYKAHPLSSACTPCNH